MRSIGVVSLPRFDLVAVRHVGPFHEIGPAFARLSAYIASKDVDLNDVTFIGRYLDDPTTCPAAELRSDACCTVPDDFECEEGFSRITIHPGQWLVADFHVENKNFSAAWDETMCHFARRGYTVGAQGTLEIYDNLTCTDVRLCVSVQP